MPDRKSFVSTLCLTFSLALLACAVVAPSRMSRFVTVSSRPDCVRRDFAPASSEPTSRFSAAMATDAVMAVDALASESEEQERADALAEPRVALLIPCSFRKVLDHQAIATRAILSVYPLRC